MKKSMKIIFTLSILLNLALVGAVGGQTYKRYQWHQPPAELGEQSRDVMRQKMKAAREDMRAQFQKMREHHQALKDIISAPEFDTQAYDAGIEKILGIKDDIAHHKAAVMGQILSELSQEERQKMSGRLLHSLSGKPSKHRRSHRKDRQGLRGENIR